MTLCPMSRGESRGSRECVREKCEWWNPIKCRCSIFAIGMGFDDLSDRIIELQGNVYAATEQLESIRSILDSAVEVMERRERR